MNDKKFPQETIAASTVNSLNFAERKTELTDELIVKLLKCNILSNLMGGKTQCEAQLTARHISLKRVTHCKAQPIAKCN